MRTRQDLQLISGLPPLVREKDSFQALLTVRNGTAKAMTVSVAARSRRAQSLDSARKCKLDAEGAAEVAWTAQAPEGVSSLVWEFEASEEGGSGQGSAASITQQVAPAVPVTVQQATFARIEGKLEVPVAPAGRRAAGQGRHRDRPVAQALDAAAGTEALLRGISRSPAWNRRPRSPSACTTQKRWQQIVDACRPISTATAWRATSPANGPGSVALTAYLLDVGDAAGFAAARRTRAAHGATA